MIEISKCGTNVYLRVRTEMRRGAELPADFDISAVAYTDSAIVLTPQWWMFPKTNVAGVPTRPAGQHPNDPDWWGTAALGLRCLSCLKVFFVSDLSDLHHECSGYPSEL